MIRLNNCTKIYDGDNTVLDNVSLEIEEGEFVAFTGKSGSGKSTLMNIVGTIDKMTSGELYFWNENVSKFRNKQLSIFRNENIGFIFQSFCLLQNYTVYENMEIPLLYSKKKIEDKKVHILEVLKKFNIMDLENKKIANLSGGEKQRVAIARAMINNPKLIIADEPTGNLDLLNTNIVMDILSEINYSGITVIIVTHDLEVAKVCKKIYEIKNSKLHKLK